MKDIFRFRWDTRKFMICPEIQVDWNRSHNYKANLVKCFKIIMRRSIDLPEKTVTVKVQELSTSPLLSVMV